MWSVLLVVVLIIYILVMVLFSIPSSTRVVMQNCKRGQVCHLKDAFKTGTPLVPMILFEYYHKKDYNEEIKERMELLAKKTNISCIVANRRSDLVFRPPSLPLHVSFSI